MFAEHLARHGLPLQRTRTRVLQLNLGRWCNQTCAHCHVNAGPGRKESATRDTLERILAWLEPTDIPVVDLTGGAPEANPHFRFLVQELRAQQRHVIDRCNLTILSEPGFEDMAGFLADQRVEVVASLPCYGSDNVDKQRGDGVFVRSIAALRQLNALGYGHELPLHLVYNPLGPTLPPPQADLEAAYKRKLRSEYGIEFHRLFTLTNMPIARFASALRREGRWDEYLQLLVEHFNPQSVERLMCRDTLNVSWRGQVFDCDFNQMLNLHWRPLLWELDRAEAETHPIRTGLHCFGCTAGSGSSCGGALI